MTDTHSPSPETRAGEASRRRWITLGELLAVAAVLISALTLWNSWSERTTQEKRSSTRAATLTLRSEPARDGARLDLKPGSDDQAVQSQTVRFPTALGVGPGETTGEPRIEASWFDTPLKRAREKAGLPDDSRGDERLPVAITTRYLVDGETHEDIALYDVGYTVEGRMLGGHNVTLRGISLVSRVKAGAEQAKLDARWQAMGPTRKGD